MHSQTKIDEVLHQAPWFWVRLSHSQLPQLNSGLTAQSCLIRFFIKEYSVHGQPEEPTVRCGYHTMVQNGWTPNHGNGSVLCRQSWSLKLWLRTNSCWRRSRSWLVQDQVQWVPWQTSKLNMQFISGIVNQVHKAHSPEPLWLRLQMQEGWGKVISIDFSKCWLLWQQHYWLSCGDILTLVRKP